MEKGLTKQQIISQLMQSSHGDLKAYIEVTKQAVKEDPEFLAHLIAWNNLNGQIRDSKVALPVSSLKIRKFSSDLEENSFAHLALLDPRNLVRAWRFAMEIGIFPHMRQLKRLIELYLRVRESDKKWFDSAALQSKRYLKELYALGHIKPNSYADAILFKRKYPSNSVFAIRKNFINMSDDEVAKFIINKKIPFLTVQGSLGDRIKNDTIMFAVLENMTPTEVQTNMAALQRWGVTNNSALRGSLEEKLTQLASSKKNTLKTSKAVEAVKDVKLKEKLRAVQEKQIKSISVDGNWLVLGDKSGSMASCIEIARQVAGTLAKMVKGDVHLIFFDTAPRYLDVTGLSYDEILKKTKNVTANGGTSIGVGLDYLLTKGIEIDGIAIVSDGGENATPFFHTTYKKYVEKFGKEVPVYFYNVWGSQNQLSHSLKINNIDFQEFDLYKKQVDYYSLPNLVQTMRVNKYSLLDAVMETKLLSMKDVFKKYADAWY